MASKTDILDELPRVGPIYAENESIMPTIKRIGPYRMFFYTGDKDEPPHVHVERDDKVAKFWLDPVRLQASGGFNRAEITRVRRLIDDDRNELFEAWNDYFSS